MKYVAFSFGELVEIMAACERLGLFYVVQKDFQDTRKWFGQRERRMVYTLQVIEYREDESSESVDSGIESESETSSTNG